MEAGDEAHVGGQHLVVEELRGWDPGQLGDLDGAAGLRFMGVLDAEHNYRPKIF